MSKYLKLMITSKSVILCVTNRMHHLAIGKVYKEVTDEIKFGIFYFEK